MFPPGQRLTLATWLQPLVKRRSFVFLRVPERSCKKKGVRRLFLAKMSVTFPCFHSFSPKINRQTHIHTTLPLVDIRIRCLAEKAKISTAFQDRYSLVYWLLVSPPRPHYSKVLKSVTINNLHGSFGLRNVSQRADVFIFLLLLPQWWWRKTPDRPASD